MKLNNIILPLVAGAMLLSGCYDEKMDWHTPSDHGPVVTSEIPLALQEEIANYDYIKNYAQQYMPNVPIGLGINENMYANDDAYAKTAVDNFTMLTPGNIMKEGSVVQNDGSLNFTAIDAFMEQATADNLPVFGHNFIWETQQNSTYLKSLVAPKETTTSTDKITNILSTDQSTFDSGTLDGSWNSWGNNSSRSLVSPGYDGSGYCLALLNPANSANPYDAQCVFNLSAPLKQGTTYTVRFMCKSTTGAGQIQFAVQNGDTYGDGQGWQGFNVGTDWTTCVYTFTASYSDQNQLDFNFASVAATYYIDNVEFGEGDGTGGTLTTYTFKTLEEKQAALTTAMHDYIFGMAQHCPTIKEWDVVNEPILDRTNTVRGVGDDAFNDGDAMPVEDPATGLTMNWADGTWYWGYYLGEDYGVQAFKMAREAVGSDAKLYINDYNLEVSPGKLQALIDYVNYIEANGAKVDGIGTQMHITSGQVTQDQVDAMFKTLAATGKLVRISELDDALGTATPTTDQLVQQEKDYEMIVSSYVTNVPAAQQGGICFWTLSDATTEHALWIPNDAPSLFDATYARKPAYKGVCDGIAGTDIGASFNGDQWMTGK